MIAVTWVWIGVALGAGVLAGVVGDRVVTALAGRRRADEVDVRLAAWTRQLTLETAGVRGRARGRVAVEEAMAAGVARARAEEVADGAPVPVVYRCGPPMGHRRRRQGYAGRHRGSAPPRWPGLHRAGAPRWGWA